MALSIGCVSALAVEPSVKYLDYDYMETFSEGMALVYKDCQWGFIDKTGKLVVGLQYDSANSFHNGYASVAKYENEEMKVGFIDKTGKVVVPVIYDTVFDFSEGLAAVVKEGKLGFVDTAGNVVVPFEYDYGAYEEYYFSGGLAVVTTGDYLSPRYLAVDKTGKKAFDINYDYARTSGFSEGMLAVGSGGKWDYDYGFAYFRYYDGGKYGFIDATGKEIVPLIYDYVGDFHDGIAVVGKDGKFGAIDKKGNVVVPLIYSNAGDGSNGLLCVENENGKCGYVDYKGNVVIDFKFDYLIDFKDGYAINSIDWEWGAVDTAGRTVIPFEHYYIYEISEGLFAYEDSESGCWGYMDANGKVVIDPVYYDAQPFSGGVALVFKEQYGIISRPSISYKAVPTASTVLVNGSRVAFDAYNIGGNNYFKLRDLAYVLNGTDKQFEVTWDNAAQAINLTPGKSYTAVGGEMAAGKKDSAAAYLSTAIVYLGGNRISLTAYNIGGNNYFKLRDLGKTMNFGVTWDAASNTIRIDTSSGYSE